MGGLMKERQKVQRIEVRLNPLSNELDAVILAKIDCLPVAASHLLKMLLVDYFTGQSGGLGLSPDEMKVFAEMSPRFANKNRKAPSFDGASLSGRGMEGKKYKEPDVSITVDNTADGKMETVAVAVVDNNDSNVVVPGSGKPPWGPGNLPPFMDMSDFENFAG